MKNKKKKMRLSKFTKLTLSALMVLTCVHFSSVKAEDSSVEGSSSPETVEIVETQKVEETPDPTATPEIVETTPEPTPEVVESTPEPTPEVVESTPEPTPEVVEATPDPTVEPVTEETPAPAAETPAPVEASKEATEDKTNTATEGYKLVEVTTLEEENFGEGTSVDENKEAAETFKVNYEVVVNGGEPLSDYENVVTLEGIKSEVNASETVSFTVSPKKGYTVLSVKQNDTALTATENQYTTDSIEAETTIRIELHEEVAAEEPVDENQIVSADVSTTKEIMTDFYVKADRSTVTVGEKVNVKAIIKPDSFSNKSVKWTSSNPEIATVDENGLVTTHAVGTVKITGQSVANKDMTDFDIITINPIQVSKITITGYTKEYMLPKETVKLNATVEPDTAADKTLIWTSSDETIATVVQDGNVGNVTALKQGEVTIRVANETSGKYAEQKIKVYDATPKTATVQVWVTNQYRGVSYQINLPADGTEVNASDVIQKVDGYVSTNIIRIVQGESGSDWSNIQKLEPVQKFKYENSKIKYTTDGSNWNEVGSNKIVAFYAISTNNTNPELGTTDVRVALGDWPYAENEAKDHDRQTIQITIVDGSNNLIYDSGRLRYDNNSNGEYGKIEFNCDESRYEIKEILVYQSKDSGTGTLVKTYTSVPTGGISVSFKTGETNHYLIKSVVTPKEFDVTYDINGGKEGSGPASTKLTAVNGTKVTVATSPQPTKEGYIFAGWEYEGTTYYGGESFEMPAHSVTFKAKWLQSSGVITYSSNNEEWGTVSRSYETLKAGVTEVKGSAAKANEGYVFVGWKNNQDGQFVSNDSYYTPEAKPGSYTAVFKVKANIKDRLELIKADVITTYDGKAHAAGTATVTGDDVVGIKIEYQKADGSWTTNPSEITATNVSDSKTVNIRVTSEKYNGELTGTEELTITKREVTLTSETAEKPYDGTPLTRPTVKVEGDGFVDGEVRDLRATGTITNVGRPVTNTIEYTGVESKFNADNYEIKKHEGTLRITKAGKVGLTVEGAERKYNGEPLSATKVETSVTKGTTISYSIDDGSTWTAEAPSITNAGTLKVTVKAENPNYKTATSEYTLTITKREVTLTSETAEKPYDGTPLTRPTVKVEGDGFVDGEVRDLRATGTITNVGRPVTNTIEYTGVESKFNADNYEIKKHEGTLTITPKEVTVTVENKTKQFGEADPELTSTVTGLVEGETIDYTVTRDAGENVGEYVITASGADVQGNYTVTYEAGKLTITAKSIIPGDETGISVTGLENVMYDGQNHKQEPIVTDTKTDKVLVSETDYILVYPEDTTNAGTVTITVKGIGNYSGEPTVSYVITKRNVKLTSETAEKPYDGTALTRPTVKVEGDGFVEGEVTDLKATGTITNVGGPVDNPITFTTLENFKDGNYTIEQVVGNLTITAKSIEGEDSGLVVEKPADVPYNGKEQKQKPVVKDTKLNTTLEEDTDYTLTYSEDVKNAGKVTVTVTGKGNYEGTLETTYSIIARNVTLTSGSASKEYDGKPLTKAGVVISEDGFVEDEVADVLAVGSITNVGSVDNTIKIVATDKFNENNYVIKYELGKLTVTEKNDPKPEPTEEPKGCPVDTVWNEEKGICEKAVVVPVVPGGGNKPKVTPEPTIAPSETPEASATPTIEPTSTPKPTSIAETGIIDDDATPSTTRKAHWALINLIAAIGSVLFGLLLLLSKNEKDNDNEDEEATDEEGTQKRNKVWKVVSLVDAIIAVVVFVLTENMKQPMVLVDKWTMLMILFTLISIVSFAFGRKYHEEDNTAENA